MCEWSGAIEEGVDGMEQSGGLFNGHHFPKVDEQTTDNEHGGLIDVGGDLGAEIDEEANHGLTDAREGSGYHGALAAVAEGVNHGRQT
jgi:hypothetical protein